MRRRFSGAVVVAAAAVAAAGCSSGSAPGLAEVDTTGSSTTVVAAAPASSGSSTTAAASGSTTSRRPVAGEPGPVPSVAPDATVGPAASIEELVGVAADVLGPTTDVAAQIARVGFLDPRVPLPPGQLDVMAFSVSVSTGGAAAGSGPRTLVSFYGRSPERAPALDAFYSAAALSAEWDQIGQDKVGDDLRTSPAYRAGAMSNAATTTWRTTKRSSSGSITSPAAWLRFSLSERCLKTDEQLDEFHRANRRILNGCQNLDDADDCPYT